MNKSRPCLADLHYKRHPGRAEVRFKGCPLHYRATPVKALKLLLSKGPQLPLQRPYPRCQDSSHRDPQEPNRITVINRQVGPFPSHRLLPKWRILRGSWAGRDGSHDSIFCKAGYQGELRFTMGGRSCVWESLWIVEGCSKVAGQPKNNKCPPQT